MIFIRDKIDNRGGGYALPSIIIISTALLIICTAVLQNSVSARQSLLTQYYTGLAGEAAEAGVEYSIGCISKGMTTWSDASPLRPNTNCTGATSGGHSYVTQGQNGWNSSFAVSALEARADGAMLTKSTGTTTLGNGRTYSQTIKRSVSGAGFVQIAAKEIVNGGWGSGHVGLLGTDNQLYGLGANNFGELGNGTTADQPSLVKFNLPSGLTVKKVAHTGVGTSMSAVIASDGQVYGSGYNSGGALGNGNTTDQSTPQRFQLPAGLTAQEVVIGGIGIDNMYVLASDHQVYGSGSNNFGQLGTGNTTNRNVPYKFPLPVGMTARAVATGGDNTYVLASDNNVYAIGRNEVGQLGIGNTSHPTLTPTKMILPAGVTAKSIAPSYHDTGFVYVLGSNNQVYGAGYNGNGQLGNGNTTNQSTPVKFNLPAGLSAVNVLVGQQSACVVASNYQMYCAGRNNFGQLGIGNTTNQSTPQRFQLPAGRSVKSMESPVRQVETGPDSTILDTLSVVTDDGQIYSAGKNDAGQIGDGTFTNRSAPTRMNLPGGVRIQKLTMGNESHYGIATDGTIYATGWNNTYQLGDGTTTNRSAPVTFRMAYIPIAARTAQSVFAYANMTEVLASDNQVYAAGSNSNGQMGIGNTSTPQASPVRFPLPAGLSAVSMTGSDNIRQVIASNGQVYVAGANQHGQLGIGNSNTPQTTVQRFQLPANVTASKVIHGIMNTVVLTDDHRVYTAGYNLYGQLGDGTTTNSTSPITFGSLTNIKDIVKPDGTTGNSFSTAFALTADGQVYGAGRDDYGQLGTGTATNLAPYGRLVPVQMVLPSGVTSVQKIAASGVGTTTAILGSNHQVYSYGRNQMGQMGNGVTSTADQTTGVMFDLPGSLTARDVVQVGYTTYVLASDNQVYGAGYNGSGQLGNGNTVNQAWPVKFNLPAGVTAISMIGNQNSGTATYSYANLYVLGSDGQLYGAGSNAAGQLGQGHNSSPISTPVSVPLPSGLSVISASGGSSASSGSGASHIAIIASDWKLYTYGQNFWGQLGDGTTSDRWSRAEFDIPVPVTSSTSFKF